MSIRKRINKNKISWEFCITIQNHPRKQYRRSGFKTKFEAQRAEEEAIIKYKNKKIELNPRKTTFSNVINLYIDHISNNKEYSDGTISNYKGYFNNHLQYFYDMSIEEITPFIIQKWYDYATLNKSAYIINGCRKLCKAAFNYAVRLKLLSENPFEYIKKAEEPIIIRQRFTIDEVKRIIKLCFDKMPNFYCIFCISIFTGMRLGEYSALTKDDIDFKNNKIYVTKQYTRRQLKQRTKTRTSSRVVDVPNSILKIINWHIKKYYIFSGFLFQGKKGKPISPNWVTKKFKTLLLLAGYPEDYMRVHDLRGQYVDISHSLGLPTVYISRQVGHARTSTTNDIYTQILSDVNVNAIEKIDQKIFL